jgi:hypothetical protein
MTTATTSTAKRIREYVMARPIGEPFTLVELRELGSRGAVDHALARLAHEGVVVNVARGIYVRPKVNPLVGRVPPSAESIVRALAAASQSVVEIHGAEAARQFGLTTQMPAHPVYTTSGRSRTIEIGEVKIELRHAAPSRLLFAGTRAGRAYAALRYLGKSEVTATTIEAVKRKLPPEEFARLASERRRMPAWLGELIRPFAPGHEAALV